MQSETDINDVWAVVVDGAMVAADGGRTLAPENAARYRKIGLAMAAAAEIAANGGGRARVAPLSVAQSAAQPAGLCQGLGVHSHCHDVCPICKDCGHYNRGDRSRARKLPPLSASYDSCPEYAPCGPVGVSSDGAEPMQRVRHNRTGVDEVVLFPRALMKDSANGWVDAVVYQGVSRQSGLPMVFCRSQEDFARSFSPSEPDSPSK